MLDKEHLIFCNNVEHTFVFANEALPVIAIGISGVLFVYVKTVYIGKICTWLLFL